MLVLVDDAQWLDGPSAAALLFAARRLLADAVVVIVAVRSGEPSAFDDAGLDELALGGLGAERGARAARRARRARRSPPTPPSGCTRRRAATRSR